MSANFRCYDPDTGQVTFDLSSHTSRLIAIFGADVNEKTHTFSDNEMGGGKIFWYATDPSGGSSISYERNRENFVGYRDLQIVITDNQIYFKKMPDITLYVGVMV